MPLTMSPGGVICTDCKFGHKVVPLKLVPKLARSKKSKKLRVVEIKRRKKIGEKRNRKSKCDWVWR